MLARRPPRVGTPRQADGLGKPQRLAEAGEFLGAEVPLAPLLAVALDPHDRVGAARNKAALSRKAVHGADDSKQAVGLMWAVAQGEVQFRDVGGGDVGGGTLAEPRNKMRA